MDARADGATADGATTDGGSACGMAFGPRCNLVTSAGCMAGQGCYYDPNAMIRQAVCRTAGSAGWGERCDATTPCREGFACLGNPGACTKLCCPGDNATCRDEAHGGRAGARCVGTINNLPGVQYCLADSSCDPFATTGNGCTADTPRCEPLGDSATCVRQGTGCTPGGDGAACCANSCCQPGFICTLSADAGTCDPMRPNGVCRRTCNSRATMPDAACPTNQRCIIQFNPASGLPDYFRACAPPGG